MLQHSDTHYLHFLTDLNRAKNRILPSPVIIKLKFQRPLADIISKDCVSCSYCHLTFEVVGYSLV